MPKKARILLSEGSSLSARQTITALGMAGYRVDLCAAGPQCLGRFSRYVDRVHISPAASDDPGAYLDFVRRLLRTGHYDVLLPTHEQAFLFAKAQESLRTDTHMALAPFSSFMQVQSKAAGAELFSRLGIPQPAYAVFPTPGQMTAWGRFPAYAKLAYGTAGQSVWRVRNAQELKRLLATLKWEAPNQMLVQAEATGVLCQAQALCSRGLLIALHCTRQRAAGIGNSQSARESAAHPEVHQHLSRVCRELSWHGPIAVDYLYDPEQGPQYIEVNPRLVEPMNAALSGLNLAALTVELSLKGELPVQTAGRSNLLSHSLMATALGTADRTHRRRRVLADVFAVLTHTGRFQQSHEDLTPVFRDAYSLLPLVVVLMQLLISPRRAGPIAAKSINTYSLTAGAIRQILGV